MREMKNMYKILTGKPEKRRPLEIFRYRWEEKKLKLMLPVCAYLSTWTEFICLRIQSSGGLLWTR
jgi:hypothetical protein